MKKLMVGVAAVAAMLALNAQDDDFDFESDSDTEIETADEDDGEAEAEADEGEDGEAKPAKAGKKQEEQEKSYFILPLSSFADGKCEVLVPTKSEWQAVEEGRFYPLGSQYRTVGAEAQLKLRFGMNVEVTLKGDSLLSTVAQALGGASRTVVLGGGAFHMSLPRNMPEGKFFVTAPGFTILNAAGDSSYTYEKTGDGDRCFVKCLTGNLSVKGRHFDIIGVRASQGFEIRTSSDKLFTGLYGKAGDLNVKLDTGLWETMDFETHERTSEQRFADFKLSPKTAVRIHRAVPEIGENLAVTIMTFDSNGNRRDRYWFAENHFESSGSEIASNEDADAAERAKKKAAESDDTVAVDADIDEEEDDSSGDEAADEDSTSIDDDLDF